MRKLLLIIALSHLGAAHLSADEPLGGSGYVAASAGRVVRADSPGVVTEVLVELGDAVGKGDVIAVLRSDDLSLAVHDAEAEHRDAVIAVQIAEARLRLTSAGRSDEDRLRAEIAGLELQRAKGRVESAEKKVALLRQRLERLRIRSPIDGRMTRVDCKVGDVVEGGDDPLATVSDLDELLVRMRFPAAALPRLSAEPDVEVTLRAEAIPGPFRGAVRRIAEVVDPRSQTVETEIAFDAEQAPPLLRPGMRISAELE